MVTLNAYRKPSWLKEEIRGKGLSKKRSPVTPSLHSLLKMLSLSSKNSPLDAPLADVEEVFLFPRKRPLEVPLLNLKKKETLLLLHSPSQQSYEVTSDLFEQGGKEKGEEVHGR